MRVARIVSSLPRGSIVAGAAMLTGCNFSLHGGFQSGATPEKAVETVFTKAAIDGSNAGYAAVSPNFRRLVGPNAWKAFVTGMGLPRYQSVTWTGHETLPAGVRVSGILHTRGAVGMPIDVTLSSSPGGWQMDRIHFHRPTTVTVGEGARDPAIPRGVTAFSEAALAAACRQLLARETVPVQQVVCMQALPGLAGLTSQCIAITQRRVVGVTARVNSYDAATQNADLSCRITDPDQPADGALV